MDEIVVIHLGWPSALAVLSSSRIKCTLCRVSCKSYDDAPSSILVRHTCIAIVTKCVSGVETVVLHHIIPLGGCHLSRLFVPCPKHTGTTTYIQRPLMDSSNMLAIGHDDGLPLVYLAEGAANVVYRIRSLPLDPSTSADLSFESYGPNTPPPTEIEPLHMDPRLEGKLVRLRKKTSSTTPVAESQKHFDNMIKPLFPPENLVQQILFQPSKDLLKDCNARLREMENNGARPAKRHDFYLAEDETYGMLVTDMSCSDDSYQFFEFKPKWLAQSPSAPLESKRCRTCALRAMKKGSKPGLCPLNLMDKSNIVTAVCRIMGLDLRRLQDYSDSTMEMLDRLRDFLLKDPLLRRLRQLQIDKDPNGVLKANIVSPDCLSAMTLRDCTLYLKVGQKSIDARLGDLDLKSGKGKAEYWRGLERQLIHGGWYTATENEKTVGENLCQLA